MSTVGNIEQLGIDQHQKYVTEVLKNRDDQFNSQSRKLLASIQMAITKEELC